MSRTKTPILRQTGKGFSYFSFIADYWKAKESGWDRAFHRLCSLMRKMDAQHVIIEKLESTDNEVSEESTALNTYYGKKTGLDAYRFTFLSQKISNLSDVKFLSDDKFFSSAILINFIDDKSKWHSYLHKAVVCIPKISGEPLLNNYIHIRKDFTCSVNLGKGVSRFFSINGTYFCQQNSVTSVCAHASLCMIINNMDRPGSEMISNEWINTTLRINHTSKKVGPDRGLKEHEVMQVLEKAGLKANWHNFFDDPNSDYAEYVYRYIEGKCPALLIFSTHHSDALHVVPVIGHTLNSDFGERKQIWLTTRRFTCTIDPRLNG